MVDLDNLPGSILDATAAAIGESYDCTRVWSAWGYGTMSQDDFVRIDHDNDRVAEIAKSAVEAFINETGFYSIVAERDALKAELKATESRLHEVAVGCANAEFELEAARKQEPAIYRLRYTEATSGWVDVKKEVYDRHKDSQNYEAKVLYASPVPAQQPAEVTPEMLRAAQTQSELGAIACSEMAGAYDLITELYEVMYKASLKGG